MLSLRLVCALALTVACNVHCFDVENAIEHMLDEISNMREDIKALQLKTQKLRDTNFIGFAVHSVNSKQYDHGATVLYDTETYDIGSGYDSSTGEYACPYPGYYFFSVSLSTNTEHHSSAMLYKKNSNGDQTAYVAAFADKSNNDQGSISYIIQCDSGDKVFVKQENNSGGTMDGSRSEYGGPLNAFTGFLVEQIY